MNTIKERTESFGILREAHTHHSLAYFERLFEEAKRDFPFLEPKDITVVQYAGKSYGTWGIEFTIPEGTVVPEEYSRIEHVELTR